MCHKLRKEFAEKAKWGERNALDRQRLRVVMKPKKADLCDCLNEKKVFNVFSHVGPGNKW